MDGGIYIGQQNKVSFDVISFDDILITQKQQSLKIQVETDLKIQFYF